MSIANVSVDDAWKRELLTNLKPLGLGNNDVLLCRFDDDGACIVVESRNRALLKKAEEEIKNFVHSTVLSYLKNKLPMYWNTSDDNLRIVVAPNSDEWLEMIARFKRGFNCDVVSLERIQNKSLWDRYSAQLKVCESSVHG